MSTYISFHSFHFGTSETVMSAGSKHFRTTLSQLSYSQRNKFIFKNRIPDEESQVAKKPRTARPR